MSDQQVTSRSRKLWRERLLPFGFAAALAVAVLAAWHDMQPVEGQLILADTACKLIEYHGGKVEGVPGTEFCVMRTRFRAPEHGRLAQVTMQTDHGAFKLELAASQIVSLAVR